MGDDLGSDEYFGYQGGQFQVAAAIAAVAEAVDGTHVRGGFSILTVDDNNVLHHRVRVDRDGNLGIGTTTPQARLDVNGGVRVGNDTVCNSAKTGTLGYNGGQVQYCDGSEWKAVGGQYGGMYLKMTLAGNNDDTVNWQCFGTNPYTGACSCPAGYNDHKWGTTYPLGVLWCGAYVYWFHTCWK
ncbi:MAG: hypothetical protein Q8O30_04695 [Candidatus Omnitrophota bacterium]|nr:hypothetical protein [Candidatus Omnitrophota bacterium]